VPDSVLYAEGGWNTLADLRPPPIFGGTVPTTNVVIPSKVPRLTPFSRFLRARDAERDLLLLFGGQRTMHSKFNGNIKTGRATSASTAAAISSSFVKLQAQPGAVKKEACRE
jgi:hypothetical protein